MARWKKPPPGKATDHFAWAQEISCNHCGRIPDVETCLATARWMEQVRERLGGRIVYCNSWCRCEQYNAAVGGALNSYHVKGMAVDITVRGLSPAQVWRECKKLQSEGLIGGLGKYVSFCHIDRGPRRSWNGP